VFGFLLANRLFAGAEIAVLSVRKTRLREFIRRRDKRALAVKALRDQPERFLATVQIAITTVGTRRRRSVARASSTRCVQVRGDRPRRDCSLLAVILLIVFSSSSSASSCRSRSRSATRIATRSSSAAAARARADRAAAGVDADRDLEPRAALLRRQDDVHRGAALARRAPAARRGGGQDRLGGSRASEIASRALGFGEVTVAEVMSRGRASSRSAAARPREIQRVILEEGHSACRSTTARSTTSSLRRRPRRARADLGEGPARPRGHPAPAAQGRRGHEGRSICCARCSGAAPRWRSCSTTRAGCPPRHDRGLIEELVGDIMSEDDVPEQFFTREPSGRSSCRLGVGPQGQPRPPPRPAGWKRSHDDRGPVHVARPGHPAGRREAHHR